MQRFHELVLLSVDEGINRIGDAIGSKRLVGAVTHLSFSLVQGAVPTAGGSPDDRPSLSLDLCVTRALMTS